MGLIVPIVVHTTLEAAPATFTHLVARFLPHMPDWYATLDELGTAERKRALPAEMITNDLSALVSDMLHRPQCLAIGGNYLLTPDAPIELSLECSGTQYNWIWLVTQGTIAVTVKWRDMTTLPSTPYRQPVWAGATAWPAQPYTDFEELVFRILGLLEPTMPDPNILQGLVSPIGSWEAGPFHVVQYHRDLCGFAQDFAQMYALYHWGIHPWTLLSTGTSAWELHATDRTRLAYGEPPYADQWYWQDKESLSIRHFLEQLDEATAYRLSQISQPDMAHLLRAAVAHLPEVRGFDFGEHGVVLTTSPGLTLWRVYDYIARNAGV